MSYVCTEASSLHGQPCESLGRDKSRARAGVRGVANAGSLRHGVSIRFGPSERPLLSKRQKAHVQLKVSITCIPKSKALVGKISVAKSFRQKGIERWEGGPGRIWGGDEIQSIEKLLVFSVLPVAPVPFLNFRLCGLCLHSIQSFLPSLPKEGPLCVCFPGA